jgi:hypothetical protein
LSFQNVESLLPKRELLSILKFNILDEFQPKKIINFSSFKDFEENSETHKLVQICIELIHKWKKDHFDLVIVTFLIKKPKKKKIYKYFKF